MAVWSIGAGGLRTAGAVALVLAFSALGAIAFFSERVWGDFERSRQEGQIASRVLDLDRRVLGWVRDAETGQRGFLLTGRPEYLEPYRSAIKSLPADLRELRSTVARQGVPGDRMQQTRVQQLDGLIADKLAELKLAIETRDAAGAAAALAIVASGRGQKTMDEIRAVCNQIAADAEERWTSSRTAMRLHTGQARFVTMGGVVVLALLVIGAFIANERSAKQRESLIEKLAEANRNSSEVRELLRTTFYSIGDGVITTDAAGAVQLTNSMAERLTGWSEEQARGKPVEEVFQVDTGARHSASPVRTALKGEVFRPPGAQSKLTSKTGAEFLVEASAAPIRNPGGALRGAVLVFRDVTEFKRGEERLRQVAKLESLGVLAGGIAHDFNNILVGIVGTAGLLEDYFPPGAAGRELVDMLRVAGDRASQLTNQMLAYSGRGRFVVRALDLSSEVEEIATLVRSSVSKNVALRLSLTRGLPKVEADAAQVQQLVMNLLINAAEAVGEAGGSVAAATSARTVIAGSGPANVLGEPLPPGAYVVLSVSDTGHGMDEATRARIFDPFFTTKFTGRGLGLAATLGIVKGHGGAIEVESALGQGATFRVYFPAVQEVTDAPTASGSSTACS